MKIPITNKFSFSLGISPCCIAIPTPCPEKHADLLSVTVNWLHF